MTNTKKENSLSTNLRASLRADLRIIWVIAAKDIVEAVKSRAILAVLLAAMIIALAMLIPTLNLAWPWSLITWIIVASFVVMIILGLWLVISILRSGGDI